MRTTLSKTDVRLTSGAKTAWLKGFINPRKTSMYQLELFSSGDAFLYVSSDEDSANKVLDEDFFSVIIRVCLSTIKTAIDTDKP